MPADRPRIISSSVSSPSEKYFSIRSSAVDAAASRQASMASSTSAFMFSGTGISCMFLPLPSNALPLSTSTMPLKFGPSPMGSTMGMMHEPYFSRSASSVLRKSTCSRSIWLTAINLARSLRLALFQAFSAPVVMPDGAPTTMSTPSTARSGPTASPMKSK